MKHPRGLNDIDKGTDCAEQMHRTLKRIFPFGAAAATAAAGLPLLLTPEGNRLRDRAARRFAAEASDSRDTLAITVKVAATFLDFEGLFRGQLV